MDPNNSSVSNGSTIDQYYLHIDLEYNLTTSSNTSNSWLLLNSSVWFNSSYENDTFLSQGLLDQSDLITSWANVSTDNYTEEWQPSILNESISSVAGQLCNTNHSFDCLGHVQEVYNWLFLLLLLFIGAGVVGNTLVCLAIGLERRLQNMTNYFLLSLSVADLLVSLVVMPFGLISGFLGYWPFDAVVCNVYVTCDVLACSCSIMHMCFISIGRYMGIRNPLKTRHSSKKVVMIKIASVWLLSMAITSPITILGMIDHQNIQPQPNTCTINNRFFFIFGSLFAFYVPMVFMVVSYVLTVQLLREQGQFGENVGNSRLSCRLIAPAANTNNLNAFKFNGKRSFKIESNSFWSNNGHVNFQNSCKRPMTCERGTQTPLSISTDRRRARLLSFRNSVTKTPSNFNLKFLSGRRRSPMTTNTVANEQKASKVLGLVFSTFVICWGPFFILNIVFAACPSCHVSINIVDTCLWLGYVSSTINPIIYTIFNKTFKEAFVKLLMCNCVFHKRCSNTKIYRCVGSVVTHTAPRTTSSMCIKSSTHASFPQFEETIC
ncbi:hypothetical protein CHUAL_000554 [Chamberlinius hualienensis]